MHARGFYGTVVGLLFLLVCSPALLLAQGTPPPAPPAGQETPADEALEASAPVVLDGVTLFRAAGISVYPAETRAQAIAKRIADVAADPRIDPASLKVEPRADGSAIVAGSRFLLRVLDADARLEGVPRAVLADIVLEHVREAIVRYRAERRPGVLLRSSGVEVAWAVALGLALWATHRLLRALRRRIERRYGSRVRDVRFQSVNLLSAEQLWRLLAGSLRVAWGVAALLAVLVYLRFALAAFPWTRGLGLTLAGLLLRPLQILATGAISAAPNLIFLAVLVVVTRYLLKLLAVLFDAISEGRVAFAGFETDWAQPTYRIVRFFVIALAAVVAYPYIPGSSSEAFKGISLFVGVIFSLGSSSIVGNTLAGISMIYRRAFRVGDVVQIGEHFGVVEKIRTLVTHLRTFKNEEVTVPNSVILGTTVLNYSTQAGADGVILHSTVGIGYETPWRQVEAMLLEAASRVAGIRKSPPPFVLQRALADFCVTYEINVHCSDPKNVLQLYSELHANILDVFNEYGVQIMTPAYMADPAHPKVVPRSEWYAAPAKPAGVAGREGV